ncbi:hypothetical protein DKX38_028091 [Salix brachista]|uniref:Uncharacterized protein n=1 Tax=Salix brachista TaxID=2182728 RepID=A0A5N5J9E6_9ROSI|nr:hypothetical protein DKX38_028091 [Salix brachista]
MQEFERQNEKMEMVTEVMGDAIDDALERDEEEEETEELVSQVLDEIGIDVNQEGYRSASSWYRVWSAIAEGVRCGCSVSAVAEGGLSSRVGLALWVIDGLSSVGITSLAIDGGYAIRFLSPLL